MSIRRTFAPSRHRASPPVITRSWPPRHTAVNVRNMQQLVEQLELERKLCKAATALVSKIHVRSNIEIIGDGKLAKTVCKYSSKGVEGKYKAKIVMTGEEEFTTYCMGMPWGNFGTLHENGTRNWTGYLYNGLVVGWMKQFDECGNMLSLRAIEYSKTTAGAFRITTMSVDGKHTPLVVAEYCRGVRHGYYTQYGPDGNDVHLVYSNGTLLSAIELASLPKRQEYLPLPVDIHFGSYNFINQQVDSQNGITEQDEVYHVPNFMYDNDSYGKANTDDMSNIYICEDEPIDTTMEPVDIDTIFSTQGITLILITNTLSSSPCQHLP